MLKITYNSNAYHPWEEKENTWIMLSKLVLYVLKKSTKTPGHKSTNLIHSVNSAEEKGEYNPWSRFLFPSIEEVAKLLKFYIKNILHTV